MKTETILYTVPTPFGVDEFIDVYGQPDMGWYEWRVRTAAGVVLRDTKNHGYGNAEIALRDALVATS